MFDRFFLTACVIAHIHFDELHRELFFVMGHTILYVDESAAFQFKDTMKHEPQVLKVPVKDVEEEKMQSWTAA